MIKYLNPPKFLLGKKLWRVNIKMNKAMTLIEVIVVVAIIAIISGIIVLNPRPQTNLDRAARQLAADLRRAQNMAMSAEEQGGEVPCGYGIYVNSSTTYVLFYNITADCSYYEYDSVGPPALVNEGDCNSNSCLLKIIPTANSRTVAPIGVNSDIYFARPGGTTYINNGSLSIQTFIFTADSFTKTVTVTSAGKIEIQ